MKISAVIDTPFIASGSTNPIGQIVDVAVRPGQLVLEYVLINLSGVGGFDPVAFSAETLQFSPDKVSCVYTQEEINRLRPRIPTEANLPVNIEGLPPLVVGPFGEAIAPVVMGAVLNDALQKRHSPEPPASEYRWFGALKGSPAFDAKGELGAVADIEFDPSSKTLQFILIDRHNDVARFRFEDLRNIPDEENYLVLSENSDPTRSA